MTPNWSSCTDHQEGNMNYTESGEAGVWEFFPHSYISYWSWGVAAWNYLG